MPGEKMHPSLLRANQHLEKIRKEMRSVSSEMNDFYDKYMTLDDENDVLKNCLHQLLNRIEGDSELPVDLIELADQIKKNPLIT